MRVIISGAFGHIGSFLINKFQKDNRIKKILLIDNFTTQRYPVFLKLKKKKFELIDENLEKMNFHQLIQILKKLKKNMIFLFIWLL